MKLIFALVSVCALATLSACSRDPAPAPDTQAAADEQLVAEDGPTPEDTVAESTLDEPCADALDQRAMTACWSNASRAEEERVDAALKKLDELTEAKDRSTIQQQLQEDQRRWLAFVEGHCGVYGALYEGGSAAPMTMAVCRWQLAQTRVQQLNLLTQELDR